MMPRYGESLIYAVAGFLALSLFGPAWAQTPERPAAPTESVTVQSQRVRDWNYSAGFVQSLLRPSYALQGQFATWKIPLCPRVEGMSPDSAHIVVQRIRGIAGKIGAPLDNNQACVPNVIIIVSPQPQTVLSALKEKRTYLFAETPVRELEMRYPAQVWYYTLDHDYNGQYWPDAPFERYGATWDIKDIPAMKANNTNLLTGIQPELRIAAVIVDSAAIRGMALGTFADYLALLSLIQAPVTGQCQPAPSIANLFLTDCQADFHTTGLSNVDWAMLTSLYQTPDEPEKLQKVRIISNMRRNLQTAQQK